MINVSISGSLPHDSIWVNTELIMKAYDVHIVDQFEDLCKLMSYCNI